MDDFIIVSPGKSFNINRYFILFKTFDQFIEGYFSFTTYYKVNFIISFKAFSGQGTEMLTANHGFNRGVDFFSYSQCSEDGESITSCQGTQDHHVGFCLLQIILKMFPAKILRL
ncbi:hypothetical protein DSECCO2_490260 [anaerobic digester metagenome]